MRQCSSIHDSRFAIHDSKRRTRPQPGKTRMKQIVIVAVVCLLASASLDAQRGRGAGAGAAPPAPRQAAPFDLTGYWVSPVIEDWKFRMVIPNKGVFDGL